MCLYVYSYFLRKVLFKKKPHCKVLYTLVNTCYILLRTLLSSIWRWLCIHTYKNLFFLMSTEYSSVWISHDILQDSSLGRVCSSPKSCVWSFRPDHRPLERLSLASPMGGKLSSHTSLDAWSGGSCCQGPGTSHELTCVCVAGHGPSLGAYLMEGPWLRPCFPGTSVEICSWGRRPEGHSSALRLSPRSFSDLCPPPHPRHQAVRRSPPPPATLMGQTCTLAVVWGKMLSFPVLPPVYTIKVSR